MTKRQRQASKPRPLQRHLWTEIPVYGAAKPNWWHRILLWVFWWHVPKQVIVGTHRAGYDHTRRTADPKKKARRRMVQQSRRANR